MSKIGDILNKKYKIIDELSYDKSGYIYQIENIETLERYSLKEIAKNSRGMLNFSRKDAELIISQHANDRPGLIDIFESPAYIYAVFSFNEPYESREFSTYDNALEAINIALQIRKNKQKKKTIIILICIIVFLVLAIIAIWVIYFYLKSLAVVPLPKL